MDIIWLNNEELKNELEIRGLPTTGTFAQKREMLRDVLRMERDNEVDPPSRKNFDSESELCLCRAKLFTIQRDIRNIDNKNLLNEGKRLTTLLQHVRQQLLRIHSSEIDQNIKQSVLSRVLELEQELGHCQRDFDPVPVHS